MAFRKTFNTEDELKIIKGLGTFRSNDSNREPVSRKKLLRGYLSAAKLRSEWGDIDRERVIKFAKQELIREQ